MIKGLAIAAFAVIAATQGHAEVFNSDGVASGQSTSEWIKFGPDHNILDTRVHYSKFEMDDKTHPMNQMSGECFGVVEMRDGAAEGNGVCVLDGLEGDRVLLGWVARRTMPESELTGYWTVNRGMGLWLQASGGGTFTSKVNQVNGAATNRLKGAVTLR